MLRRDQLERDARHIAFDIDKLCERVIGLCHGAVSIAGCEKKEGGYSRTFILTFNNGQRLVARLPTRAAGPSRLTTNSEVATIRYLQAHTSLPIPKILDWSDDASNEIGSEYIIMEHAPGVLLHHRWPTMSGVQRIECIRSISRNTQQVAALNFPDYGSLYNDDDPIPPLPRTLFPKAFVSDPNVEQSTGIASTAAPTLCHPDLHKGNIFVSDDDPTVVTGIIDWQSSSVDPAFEYADKQPDFAAPTSNPSWEGRPADPSLELCQNAYDACLKGLVPKLAAARAVDDNLLRPFRLCDRTWRDGAVAFRDQLINLSKSWKELGLSGASVLSRFLR
ncbi:MAG: hypothetical protein Q9219_003545 [cf. Caloplaca sp. 3 TL-2023]